MEQVMAGQLMPLSDTLLGKPPLQRSSAQVQLSRSILYSRAPTSQ
jgi:hypothetical protein